MRVADAWDIGQVVVRGPSWNSSDLGMFDGGEGYLGYTSLPSEDQVKEWLAYMLFGSTRNSERPCSITGWFMEGAGSTATSLECSRREGASTCSWQGRARSSS